MTINGGTFVLASGDDGMHADETLEVNGGDIRIANSYEGLESAVITINDGDIHVVSSDDSVNVAGGNDGSGMMPGRGPGASQGKDLTKMPLPIQGTTTSASTAATSQLTPPGMGLTPTAPWR